MFKREVIEQNTKILNMSISQDTYGAEQIPPVPLLTRHEVILSNGYRGEPTDNASECDGVLDLAYHFLANKEFGKAVEYYTQVIEKNSAEVRAYIGRGDAYQNLNEWNQALMDYKTAKSLDSSQTLINIRLASLYLKRKLPNNALSELEDAIKLEPNNSDIYFWLARANYALTQFKIALANCNKAINICGVELNYYILQSIIYREMEDYAAAMKALTFVQAIDPYYYGINSLQAEILRHRERNKEKKQNMDTQSFPPTILQKRSVTFLEGGNYYVETKLVNETCAEATETSSKRKLST